MPWRRSPLLQKHAKSADHAKSAIGAGSPCGLAASHTPAPFPCLTHFPIRFPRFPTQAISPYVFSGSPIPYTGSKNPTPIPTGPAFPASAGLPDKPPGPAHRASTNAQPTNLRKSRVSGIHISPTKTRKSTSTPARPRMRNPTRRDQRPVRPDPRIQPIHSNSQQRPVHSNLRIQPVSPPSLRQRPACSNLRVRPTHSNSLHRRGGHGHDVASRRDDGVDAVGARVQAGPKAAPAARIPGEPGQAEPGKNPQTRRRIAQDGWQITQARPGVTHAPRRWGTASLPF